MTLLLPLRRPSVEFRAATVSRHGPGSLAFQLTLKGATFLSFLGLSSVLSLDGVLETADLTMPGMSYHKSA